MRILFTLFTVLTAALLLSACGFSEMSRNNANLKQLKAGMSKDEVLNIMGEPLKNEVYNTDKVWYYYTDTKWSDGRNTRDECTPVVFDDDGKLLGWGQEYYKVNYDFKNWDIDKKKE